MLEKEYQLLSAQELIVKIYKNYKRSVAIASSFGAEDVILIDMAARNVSEPRIFTLDTGRLPQETFDLMEKVRKKYDIEIEVFFPSRRKIEEMSKVNGVNLFYDDVELRKKCCQIRKIEPLNRALSGLSAWICGLRKEQSPTRSDISKVEVDKAHGGIPKINPLADWSTEQVWDYIKENSVPYNSLHDKGYPSIGCQPCTRAVRPGEDIRAGRWWWESPELKECGLHR